ncbi:MAG: AAA family ATPase [Advenella sp.]
MNNPFEKPFIYQPPEKTPAPVQVRNAMLSEGIEPPGELLMDGEIHRFPLGSSRDAGWYVIYSDGFPAGAFGDWRSGEATTWRAQRSKPLSLEEEIALKNNLDRARKAREEQRQQKAERAAETVAYIWDNAGLASEDHPYLKRKQIQPHGIRITGDGRLIVPMFAGGKLSSVQYIDSNGDKMYHSGGMVRGAFFELNAIESPDRIIFAEGFATAASIAEATHEMVVTCFSAAQIPNVVEIYRTRFPMVSFVIAADNDASGQGESYAYQAAAKSGAQVIIPAHTGDDFNDMAVRGEDIATQILQRDDSWLVSLEEFVSNPSPIQWLVKRWVQQNALMMAHGPSGSGKTFVVLDWALSMLVGRDWIGHATTQAGFAYLAGEGHKGLKKRFAGWLAYHGISPKDLPATISKSGTDLDTPAGLAQAANAIREMNPRPALIIIDTLHRFLAGDENRAQDTRAMLSSCSALMNEFGCSVLLVHHTGNSENAQQRARGSSAWKGALDIEVSITQKSGKVKILCTKSKDDEEPPPVYVELKRIDVPGWTDDDGNPETTAVVIESEKPKAKEDTELSIAQESFRLAWEHTGKDTLNEAPYVTRKAWRSLLVAHEGMSQSTAAKALQPSANRAPVFLKRLIDEKMIEREADGYIAIDQFSLQLHSGQTDR